MRTTVWRAAAMAALLAGAAGCVRTTAVRGTVTLDGVPVTEGSVTFVPADGAGPTAGARVENGAYELTDAAGLTPGPKSVRLRVAVRTGRQVEAGPPFPKGHLIDEMTYFPPPTAREAYAEAHAVEAGRVNVIDFALTSAGRPRK